MTQPVLRLARDGHEISASNKLQQALVAAEQLLVHFLGQPAALSRLEALFSGQHDLAPASWHQSAQAFLTAFQAGERSVDLDLRSAQELPTALGAFSATGTTGAPVIYLNQDWLDQLSAAAITRVILEESGHWIDNQINGSADSPGDEGEAFAAAVLGLQLSQVEAQRIQLEDDKLCITLDGIELEVELASVLFPEKAYFVSTSSSSTTTQLESNSVYTLNLIGDAADRYVFISDPTADPIFSGNNTRGYFYVVNPFNQIKSSYFGEITRLYKKGSTVEGFQFYAYPPGYVAGSGDRTTLTNITILVDLTSTGIQLNQSYGTSSDPVDVALNQLLAAAPADAVNDVASAGEKGGASNQTSGFDASGNVLNNDLGGITNYSINTSTDPDTLVITPSARAVIAASSILTGNSSSVPASTTSTTGPTNIRGFYGNLYIGADGSYRYVVDDNLAAVQALRTSGNTLLDTFSYTLLTSGSSDVATLSITIQGSNDTPVARNDYGQAKESLLTDASGAYQAGDPLGTKAIGNVLPNDTDVDAGDSKTVVGSITIAGSGIGTTAGTASVTTSAIGANVNSLNVNTSYYAYTKDASGNYLALRAFDGSIATLTRTSSGASPDFSLSDATNASAGLIVYANTTGSTYVEAFTISSVTAASGATINISAPAGSIATGMTVSGTGIPGATTVSGISYDASGNLTSITLSTAVQINGTALSFGASTAIGSSITGQYGTLILNSNGGYTYTPFNNNPGLSQGEEVTEVFSYTMQDTAGAQSTANLFIKVLGSGSTDPNAVLQSNAADEQGGINNGAGGLDPSGNLLTGTSTPSGSNTLAAIRDASGSIVDASGSIVQGGITYNAKARGLYGDLYFTTNGAYIYVLSNNSPAVEQLQAGQQLSESFEYKISNGSGSDWSTLTITINGANDTPLARPDFATALEAGGVNNSTAGIDPSGNLLLNDTDVDAADTRHVLSANPGSTINTPTSISASGETAIIGTYGTLYLQRSGVYRYVVDNTNPTVQALSSASSQLSEIFNYQIVDASGASSDSTVTISILGANDPVIVSSISVNESSPWGVFSIAGSAGQLITLDLDVVSGGATEFADFGDASGGTGGSGLEYLNSSGNWVPYTSNSQVVLDASGQLLVRASILQDTQYEGAERFRLNATSSDGTIGSGIGVIFDDGTGDYWSSDNKSIDPSLPSGLQLDDDRLLTVSGAAYNEASPYIFWTISGAAGQSVQFVGLNGDPSGSALPNADLSGTLQYRDASGIWQSFSGSAVLDPSGSLLVRKAVVNDTNPEGLEQFQLIVENNAGTDASGISSIDDDGTGLIPFLDPSGNPLDASGGNLSNNPVNDPNTTKDDDRLLTVNSVTVNEGSPFAVFTITGATGQAVFLSFADASGSNPATDPAGGLAELGSAPPLQFFNGSSWQNYDPANPPRITDPSGALLVRIAIDDEQDSALDGPESFSLIATNAGGAPSSATLIATRASGSAANGTGTITDDGTGAYWIGDSTSPATQAQLDASGITLDDDRPLTISGSTFNESSPYIFWSISGSPGQPVQFVGLNGDPSGAPLTDDLSGPLQYLNASGIWVTFDASSTPVLDASGSLQVRIGVVNDTIDEALERFTLTVENTGGSDASGISFLNDDGAGLLPLLDPSGTPIRDASGNLQPDSSGILNDDRALTVTAFSPVNEGSTYAMFTVTAAAGQGLELELGNTSSLLDIDATITAFTTEWSIDGTNWTPGNTVPSVPASGVVFVRANITSEADETFENSEAFTLSATYTTGGRLSATGIANIVDNGSGSLFDGTFTSGQPGLVNAPLDNDRAELSLPDVTVNEASPYVVFQIAGTTGQAFTLALADGGIGFNDTNDDINKQGSQRAVAGFDYQNQLEVYNGENWISYRPGTPVTIPSGGSLLLVRVPLINDTVYESVHAFTLTATPPTGSPASGRALIGDFGTGLIFNDSGAEDRNAAKDDDRQLKVDSPIVNEGSEHVVFRVTGITSPVELALQDLGIGTGFTTLTDPNLQYWTGTAWAPYVGTALSAGTHFLAGGELFVRVAIGEEQDTIREGSERFTLRVNGAGGPSLGTATIRDDGTGAIWLGNSLVPATPSELSAAGTMPDDDFDRDGIIPTTEEALATLAASQGFGAAAGDINGDGLSDALQNALATLAWRDVESFKQGNEGTLTDVKPIIALAALADASGSAVSSTLQLQDIRVLDYADPSEFGSATSAVTVDPETGERTVTLVNGATVTTPWDSLRFKLAPQDPSGSFTDLNPSRDGVQVRLFIDIRAADLDASAFNGYIKFISQATIDAAGPAGLRDLDGNLITTAGWIDFTQRTPGGDGARFVIDTNNKITGIELILTDNSVGDNDLRTNFIFDPGVPIQINDVRLVPTSDRKGLEVVGLPGQRLWADFSAVLADATLQNGYNLVRISPTGEQSPIGAIGATPESAFLGDTRVQLRVGDVVRFTQVSGSRPANSTPNLVVTGSEDCLIIRLEDGGATDNDSNDLVIKVNASREDPHPESTRMARYQLASDQAYIDLSWISAAGINLKLDVKTQAGQENTLGLVRIDTDSSTGQPLGTVGGLAPSAGASFDAAVRANLLSFRQTQSGDQTISGLDLTLQGFEAGIYAPALITPQGRVYTYGLSSSCDRKQHIRVLGANSFGFEDKGDRDFNDVVLTFEVAEREAPSLKLTSDSRAFTVVAGTGDAKGLWLDLNAVIADARWQNSFDLIKRLASGQEETVGSVGASRGGAFLGSKQLFLAIGETLRFQQNSNDNPINSDPALRITKTGERYRVALDDSGNGGIGANADFNDLIIDIDSSTLEPCTDVVKLARQQLTSADGILDLTDIGTEGLRLDLSVLTDSGKSNTLSFVKLDVDPVTGKPLKQVAGVHANADQAFRQAVRDNLIDFSLRAGGRSSQSAVWELDASDSGYYAAVLVTSDGHLFTFGDSTGADGKQHLKLLGDNSFGFEDRLTRQGADWDYNDLTVKITPL